MTFVSKRFIPVREPRLVASTAWLIEGKRVPRTQFGQHIPFGVLETLGWWSLMEEKLIIGSVHDTLILFFIELRCSISFGHILQYLRNSTFEVCFVSKVSQLLANMSICSQPTASGHPHNNSFLRLPQLTGIRLHNLLRGIFRCIWHKSDSNIHKIEIGRIHLLYLDPSLQDGLQNGLQDGLQNGL